MFGQQIFIDRNPQNEACTPDLKTKDEFFNILLRKKYFFPLKANIPIVIRPKSIIFIKVLKK